MIALKLLNYLEDFITEERKTRFTAVLKERTKQITVAIEDVSETLKKVGYKIIETTPHTDSCFLENFTIEGKITLFFETEKKA